MDSRLVFVSQRDDLNKVNAFEFNIQDEKKMLKRAANRKSASASRARKKTLTEEMIADIEKMRPGAHVLSCLPDMIVVLDQTGIINFVSDACEWIFNRKSDELSKVSMFSLITKDCHETLRNILSETFSTKDAPLSKSNGGGVKGDDNPCRIAVQSDIESAQASSRKNSCKLLETVQPPNSRNGNVYEKSMGSYNISVQSKKMTEDSSSSAAKTSALTQWNSSAVSSEGSSGSSSSGTSNLHLSGLSDSPSKLNTHQHCMKLSQRQRQRSFIDGVDLGFVGKRRLCLLRKDNSPCWTEIHSNTMNDQNGWELVMSLRTIMQSQGEGGSQTKPPAPKMNGHNLSQIVPENNFDILSFKRQCLERKSEIGRNESPGSILTKENLSNNAVKCQNDSLRNKSKFPSRKCHSAVHQNNGLTNGKVESGIVAGKDDSSAGSSDDVRTAVKSLMLIQKCSTNLGERDE